MTESGAPHKRQRWTVGRIAALAIGLAILATILLLWKFGLTNALAAQPFLVVFGLSVIVATGMMFSGLVVAGVFGIRLAARPTPEAAMLWLFLGTGTWTLVFGWLSYAGLAAPAALPGVGAVALLLLVVLAIRRRLAWLAMPLHLQSSLPLFGVLALGAVVSLLPLLLHKSPVNPHNDAAIYIAMAEYLQYHGFGTPAAYDLYHPVSVQVVHFQIGGFGIGPAFVLAMVRALFPQFLTYEIYPALVALGTILNLGGIYLLCRWSFRMPAPYTLAAVFITAVMPNPLWCSANIGFFFQTYGTAALSFALAIISRLNTPGHWRFDSAFLFGLVTATLISVYCELWPVLGIVCCGYVILNWRRCRRVHRLPRFLGFVGLTLFVILVLGNIEHARVLRGILFAATHSGCGWPFDWNYFKFWAFAMGTRPFPAAGSGWVVWAILPLTAAFLVGLRRTFRHRAAFPVGTAIAVFGGLMVYYHFFVRDPWSGLLGQTWNQFKLCKYAFPLVATIQAAGMYVLLRRLARPRRALIVCCAVSVLMSAGIYQPYNRQYAANVKAWIGCEPSYTAARELQRQLDELGVKQVYLIHEQKALWPEWFVSYLVYPRPLVSTYVSGDGFETYSRQGGGMDASTGKETLFLVQGDLPFEKPQKRLPTSLSVVSPDRPLVFKVDNATALERNADGEGSLWIGDQPTAMLVWSPRPCKAVLSFAAEPGPSLPETQRRRVRIGVEGTTPADLDFAGSYQASVPLSLKVGVTRVDIQCQDTPTLRVLPGGDRRACLVAISKSRIDYCGETPGDNVVGQTRDRMEGSGAASPGRIASAGH